MRRIDFKYLSATNFLCFGPKGIKIHLTKLGPIVVIMGRNYDDMKSGNPGSNGTGKSTIQDILVYGLFGKTVKRKLHQDKIVNNKVGSKAEVEVHWDNFRVVRGCKPTKLQLYEEKDGGWNEISAGAGVNETQKMIEARLGINHKTFVNIVCFDDRNSNSYLECDTETQRQVVDNLLSLEKYRSYAAAAKEKEKEVIKQSKLLQSDCLRAESILQNSKDRTIKLRTQQQDWVIQQQQHLMRLNQMLAQRQDQFKMTDLGAKMVEWRHSQDQIEMLNAEIIRLEEEQRIIEEGLAAARLKQMKILELHTDVNTRRIRLDTDCKKLADQVRILSDDKNRLEKKQTGVPCTTCGQVIPQDHYASAITEVDKHIVDTTKKEQTFRDELGYVNEQFKEVELKRRVINDMVAEAAGKSSFIGRSIGELRAQVKKYAAIPKPEENAETRVVEEQIAALQEQIRLKQEEISGPGPYIRNILDAEQEEKDREAELRVKQGELAAADRMIPYYSYWVKGFGDDGIRKFIIEGILPALNKRVAYWMNVLIYGNISLSFDSGMEPTITRVPVEGEDFTYNGMSGGEQRRLNLAITQAFAHIMMLNSGCTTNLMFLDEVSINIDENGIEAVYQMILQLADEGRQVFVTTHDKDLLALLQGCPILQLERREGFTTQV